jgi:ABC-type polysaccharide transport system permease subunit
MLTFCLLLCSLVLILVFRYVFMWHCIIRGTEYETCFTPPFWHIEF